MGYPGRHCPFGPSRQHSINITFNLVSRAQVNINCGYSPLIWKCLVSSKLLPQTDLVSDFTEKYFLNVINVKQYPMIRWVKQYPMIRWVKQYPMIRWVMNTSLSTRFRRAMVLSDHSSQNQGLGYGHPLRKRRRKLSVVALSQYCANSFVYFVGYDAGASVRFLPLWCCDDLCSGPG
jgi:hypothetical protein